MNLNHSLLDFFINAGPVVKVVMLILLIASLLSWTFIFQRWSFLGKVRRQTRKFEKQFYKGVELESFAQMYKQQKKCFGIGQIFLAGFNEYQRLSERGVTNLNVLQQSMRSAMLAQQNRVAEILEAHLPFLATVGSTSPYIGLFGTVWGIMTAFSALGQVQQASIAMVAPGISEALIATAMGLFAAIPAVIAYNRFNHRVDSLLNRYDNFSEDFIRLMSHQDEAKI